VGDDYYIASSTFEWFPGVPIHHSRDLVNWRLIGHALTRPSQLDLRGIADSAGVWAPSLSHADGKFWLIYTNLRQTGMGRPFKDIGIYLTTATHIHGPWSDPVVLNSIGFDPSLFHDDDGRKWLLNMEWDFRKTGVERFAGNVIQEYNPKTGKLVGPMTKILQKEKILCEGPNLYKRDGWYYLMMAEGGTGWTHSIAMARAKKILGPYELDPQPVLLTSRDDVSLPLQKAGHGELVQTPAGEWYLAHLASRPLITGAPLNAGSPDKSDISAQHAGHRCILGRETCIQKVEWRDGWLRLATGGTKPQLEVPAPIGTPASGTASFNSHAARLAAFGRARLAALAVLPESCRAAAPAFPRHGRDVPRIFAGALHAQCRTDLLLRHADAFLSARLARREARENPRHHAHRRRGLCGAG
jgi:xylan 1,4-beta-xylosidase